MSRGASVQGGFGPGCICHGACDWRFMSGDFCARSLRYGAHVKGLLTGGLCLGSFGLGGFGPTGLCQRASKC